MPRIEPVNRAKVDAKVGKTLEQVEKATGRVPNILATMAHSPAVLGSYMGFKQALGRSSFTPAERERLSLRVAALTRCEYCAAAHAAMAGEQGVDDRAIAAAMSGRADDPRFGAALAFASALLDKRGWVDDADLAAVREAGYDDGQILEIIAIVSMNLFTNYINHVAATEIDFPAVALPAGA
jgi:uncharacterized peroxidase-related enzyme